jgi:tetratricopeptide (TPR) repeat protein
MLDTSAFRIPSESELCLLSLDYLRDLRRAYAHKEDLLQAEGLDADWLSLAIFALDRAFTPGLYLENDAWKADTDRTRCSIENLPSLAHITNEVVYASNPNASSNNPELSQHAQVPTRDPKDEDLDAFSWYEYDDMHSSNQHRYYLLHGLGGSVRGPVSLGEVAAVGLSHLQARSRHAAEEEITKSQLFQHFLQAVTSKGFFKDAENDTPLPDPKQDYERLKRKELVYQERLQKVVAKFRCKLAMQAHESGDGDATLSDVQYTRRLRNCLKVRKDRTDEQLSRNFSTAARLAPGISSPKDIQEAERLKNAGNAHMQRKDYQAAAQAYTQALRLSPAGPHSHVYFSNRAAALLSMKQFNEAISDSERSLSLKPDYGKAHARLGLAHFLLGDYRHAMEAYQVALKYEPENKSSRSYLEKAQKRLTKQEDQSSIGASFSVVSEWDRSLQAPTAAAVVASSDGQKEAEKLKVLGNQLMAQRQYSQALDAYNKAIEHSHDGLQSHVYYSNRAAALCYLERYEEAEQDSLKSLQLKPDYGKAHARLGLSRFFLEDYPGAIQAYTSALKYDPNNAASKSYLSKAKLKWDQQDQVNQRSHEVDEDARRLMNDPDMRKLASKVMAVSSNRSASQQLMEDPEMIQLARKAVHDPTMMAAVKAVVNN